MCQFQDFDLEMKLLKQVVIFLYVFVVFALAASTLDEQLKVLTRNLHFNGLIEVKYLIDRSHDLQMTIQLEW